MWYNIRISLVMGNGGENALKRVSEIGINK